MEQKQSYEIQLQNAATGLVNLLTTIAPLFLVVVIIGIATAGGWLEYLYYYQVIGPLAWLPGFGVAIFRFGSGLGGIRLFKMSRVIPGLVFLTVSVVLTFWTTSHADVVGRVLASHSDRATDAAYLFKTLLWSALTGEIMIAIYMAATRGEAEAVSEIPAETAQLQPAAIPQRTGATIVPQLTATHRNETAQRNGSELRNELQDVAPQFDEPLHRNPIGFHSQRNAVANGGARRQRTPRRNNLSLAQQLEIAKRNERAQRSKLNRGIGNPETVQLRYDYWRNEIAQLEAQLSETE